jgi:tetratricopeptide (TPR) repeat protein
MKYLVITGDIIESRKSGITNEILKKKLLEIEYPDNLLAPFRLSRGDEIQAVFRGYISFPAMLRQIRYLLRPLKLRFGIGFGEIEEQSTDRNSWNMNGTAFHYAREALDIITAEDFFQTIFLSNSDYDEAINTILLLIDNFQNSWTEAQWEAVYYYEKLGTYKKAAEKLNIAFQSIGKRCKAAKWREIRYAEDIIDRIIKNMFKGD